MRIVPQVARFVKHHCPVACSCLTSHVCTSPPKCFKLLYEAVLSRETSTEAEVSNDGEVSIPFASVRPKDGFFRTNLVAYNKVPAELPPLTVEEHLLQNLKILGLTCFGIIALASLYCLGWTLAHQKKIVVQSAQPVFLIMVSLGVLLMAASLVPLSFDDQGAAQDSRADEKFGATAICMSVPWAAITGFSLILASLISKTWRFDYMFRHEESIYYLGPLPKAFFLAPLAVLLTVNWSVLFAWTLADPLVYVRLEHEGTDYWNRVLETYGVCRSQHVIGYLLPLACFNLMGVFVAAWFAAIHHDHASALGEIQHIGLSVAALVEGVLAGVPVVVVVKDMPRVYYSVLSLTIFVLCMAVLGSVFLPKIFFHLDLKDKSFEDQLEFLRRHTGGVDSVPCTDYNVGQRDMNASSSRESAYSRPYRSTSQQPSISSIPEGRVVTGSDDENRTSASTLGGPLELRASSESTVSIPSRFR